MNLWGVAVLEIDSHPDHNKGADQDQRPISKIIDPCHTTYQTTISLITRPLFGSPNFAW